MDGAVPIIYIVLVIGILVSFFMSAQVMYIHLTAEKNNQTNSESKAKRSLIISTALLMLWVIAKDTIIGYGPLLYLVPGLFGMSLFVWWLDRRYGLNSK